MEIQDLKNNRNEIIEFATEKNLELKDFMKNLVEAVEFGLNETEDVMEFVYDFWYYTYASRSRKTNKSAELFAESEFKGNYTKLDLNTYYASKQTRG